MKNGYKSLVSVLGGLVISNVTFAAAFQLYEMGTPIIGSAAVGQAALAQDASTTYFNPAGMVFCGQNQFMLGGQLLLPEITFAQNSLNTISGDNGTDIGALIPGMSVYSELSYSPNLKFGLSLNTPFGGELLYSDGWVGRYFVQTVSFYTINLNPSFAYRINDYFAVGGGVSLEYINLQQTVSLPINSQIDGQIKLNLENYAPGFNLGVMFTPSRATKIGLAYRSQITHHLSGDSTFLRINTTPTTTTTMVMPANLMLSAVHDFSRYFTLLAELGWAQWSSMQDTILTVQGFSAVTPRNWSNTYRVGVGAQFKPTPCLTVQTGVSYDSSPTNVELRLPDLPMDKQIRAGGGVIVQLIKSVTLGASYEYIDFGDAEIHNTSSNGTLSGAYPKNFANAVQVSLNIKI